MASAAITTASQYQNQTVKQRLLPKAAVFFCGQSLGNANNGASYLAIRGAPIDRVHRANNPRATLAKHHHRLAGEAPKWPSRAAKPTNDPETA